MKKISILSILIEVVSTLRRYLGLLQPECFLSLPDEVNKIKAHWHGPDESIQTARLTSKMSRGLQNFRATSKGFQSLGLKFNHSAIFKCSLKATSSTNFIHIRPRVFPGQFVNSFQIWHKGEEQKNVKTFKIHGL